ncbi:MAG: hypothetical protein EOP51_22900 [Sphingobacteriales bacterium]|nr:MAG: hypothetical protein EOP51_22900 [Sphingobacteriales bacterium]
MKKLLTAFLCFYGTSLAAQNVGVGTNNPQSQLSVGANSQFQVNESGNITRINDVPMSFPDAQGAAGKSLVNDGAGNMSWKEAGMPVGSIVMCYGYDTSTFIARGFSILGISQGYQRQRLNAAGTWTPFANTINTTGGFSMQDDPSVFTGTEMLVYRNNIVYRWNPSGTVWTQSVVNTVAGFTAPASATAVWTGTDMIIYEGLKGVKYNPATNTWTAIANSPVSKTRHSAVWTGTEMIVWGGNSGGLTQSGYKYNPASNTWSAAISVTGAPSARESHTAVWTGSRMIICLGEGSGGTVAQNTYAYNPVSNTWDAPLSAPTYGLDNPKAVWTGSVMLMTGSIYLSSTSYYYTILLSFDPATGSWTQLANEGKAGNNDERSNIVWAGSEMLMIRGNGAQKFSLTGNSMLITLPFLSSYYIMRKTFSN